MTKYFRSMLFTPGDRPDRFANATKSGADSICLDLEDAVSFENKELARKHVFEFIATATRSLPIGLRINTISGGEGLRDLIRCYDLGARPDFILIGKTSEGSQPALVRSILGATEIALWALAESPKSIYHLDEIARAVGSNGGIMFGGADYAASLGVGMTWDALFHARAIIVQTAAAFGCATLDFPYLSINDPEGLANDTRRVRDLGFGGRACIHPKQVSVVNEIFCPTQEEIADAERIIAALDAAKSELATLDGKLIDKPVLLRARRILESRK